MSSLTGMSEWSHKVVTLPISHIVHHYHHRHHHHHHHHLCNTLLHSAALLDSRTLPHALPHPYYQEHCCTPAAALALPLALPVALLLALPHCRTTGNCRTNSSGSYKFKKIHIEFIFVIHINPFNSH
jgi:hypothetical protein